MIRDQLHSDGQVLGILAARYRYGRNSCQRLSNREDIRKVHCERVVCFLADPEGDGWRCGRQNHVHTLERLLKVLQHQGSDFERLEIIRVVVAGTQSVGPQKNTALYFFTKSIMTRAAIHLLKRIPAATRTVPHAVITCQIGTGFGSSDEIVGRHRIFGVRQTDLPYLASEIFEKAYAG